MNKIKLYIIKKLLWFNNHMRLWQIISVWLSKRHKNDSFYISDKELLTNLEKIKNEQSTTNWI